MWMTLFAGVKENPTLQAKSELISGGRYRSDGPADAQVASVFLESFSVLLGGF